MKVCFINPPFKSEFGKFSRESRSPSIGHSGVLYYPLWLIYSAAVVEKEGFEIFFIDAPAKRLSLEDTLSIVEKEANDSLLFVIDTSTPSIYSDIEFGSLLKEKYPNSKIVLVGTHPSAMDIETLEISLNIDYVARKEFDYIIRDLAISIRDNLDIDKVKGITYRNKEGLIVRNENAEYIDNLDEIPMAAEFIRKYLNIEDYVFPAAAFPAIQIFTGRGCPAHCNFCVYPQTMHGHKYRLRSAKNVVNEFEYIVNNFPNVKEIVIEDDNFTANKFRVLEICKALVEKGLNKRIKWLCNARVNTDLETMIAMKKAGCHLIIPGFESYNQEILNNIRKGSTIELIDNYVENAKKAGLMIHACYMVGNKGETKETMKNTLSAALKFNTDTAQFFPLIPYPGTEAYEWALNNKYISGNYKDYLQEDGTLNCVLNTSELSSKDLVDFCSYARKKYYMRPWYILYRLKNGILDFNDMKRSIKAFWKLKDSLIKNEK